MAQPAKPKPKTGAGPPLKPFPPSQPFVPPKASTRDNRTSVPRTLARQQSPATTGIAAGAGDGAPQIGADVPYIPASVNLPEVTVKAVVLGILLSVILAAANTYLGLHAGLTVAAAIPAAVVSLAVLRMFRRHNILENNMVQTIASAGTAVASGILFTIPALLILGVWDTVQYWETTTIGVVGGLLGVLFTVPLRRALIIEENLAFPEGVATAEVLKSGEHGGSGVGALLLGGALGAGYKLLQAGTHLWSEATMVATRMGNAVTGIGTQLSVALIGVGYIIGLRIAATIFAGGLFAWLVAMPVLGLVMPMDTLVEAVPADAPDGCFATLQAGESMVDIAKCLYKYQVRYLGVGAMLVGGLYSLYKLRGPLVRAVQRGMGGARGGASGSAAAVPRTEVELSARTTFSGVGLLLIPMFFFYAYVTAWNWPVAGAMSLIMLATGFLFSAVGAYMAGIVGSSNNPISGVTILTLLASALLLKLFGLDPGIGAAATIFVAAIIAVGGSIASDNLQDLKAGHMLGATPRKQQAMIAVGAVVSAFFIAPVLQILVSAKGIHALNAPQANLMASIAGGIFDPSRAGLPYPMIGLGVLIALALVILDQTAGRRNARYRIPIMAVAVGMYLPIDTTAPIFLGGLVAWQAARLYRTRHGTPIPEGSNKGVLFASGLIAGEAILGIFTSGLAGWRTACAGLPWIEYGDVEQCNAGQYLWVANGSLEWPGLALLLYIGVVMGYVAIRGAKKALRR